jgi:hypothetical protein
MQHPGTGGAGQRDEHYDHEQSPADYPHVSTSSCIHRTTTKSFERLSFNRNQIAVRRKGQKDRVTICPATFKRPLAGHLEHVRRVHASDLAAGYGRVLLP